MKICPVCHETFSDELTSCPRDNSVLKFVSVSSLNFISGQIVNKRFKLDSRIGTGSYSQVWRAEDITNNTKVAVKLLDFQSTCIDEVRDSVSRFFREAYAASQLGHPNIVKVIDFGEETCGQLYMTMELIEGVSLTKTIRSFKWPDDFSRALNLVIRITEGMEVAHKASIIHRDLKSDNIIVTGTGADENIKILDFGTAKILDDDRLAQISKDFIYGTPSYMSPEQARGVAIDEGSDIYALGVIMFEMFTGDLPFKGYTSSVLVQHLQKPPPNPKALNDIMPKKMSDMILKCLKKDRKNRFENMADLRMELEAVKTKITKSFKIVQD
ncbi:serine/threonine protein kinase [Myxococcota bacterium]|nr:serine/threonine protein kinase [Myxococcota bacterium]MBU1379643.1 serine/threonine protein kinase [Myxococcota bacterium]MBU1498000.1 serine/threonine protein kinase [Myxococcota bacterium]